MIHRTHLSSFVNSFLNSINSITGEALSAANA